MSFHWHFLFNVIFISPTLLRQGVCVCVRMYVCVRTFWLDIKPLISAGACGTHALTTCNEAVGMSGKRNREEANIVYRCCFKLSISPVI